MQEYLAAKFVVARKNDRADDDHNAAYDEQFDQGKTSFIFHTFVEVVSAGYTSVRTKK